MKGYSSKGRFQQIRRRKTEGKFRSPRSEKVNVLCPNLVLSCQDLSDKLELGLQEPWSVSIQREIEIAGEQENFIRSLEGRFILT